MALRPARTHRDVDKPAYTRVSKRKPRLSYIKGVPQPKITIFDMGNPKGKYDIAVHLVCDVAVQIRHNALEAARVAANRYLSKTLGKSNYHFKIRVYPHQVLREHRGVGGFAGADRLSQGMKLAFGKPVGTAARVKEGQTVMSVFVKKQALEVAKEALRRAKAKLTGKYHYEIETLVAS